MGDRFQRHLFKLTFKLKVKSVRGFLFTFDIKKRIAASGSYEAFSIGIGAGAGAEILPRSRSRRRPKMSRLHIPAVYPKMLRNVEDIDIWNSRQKRFMRRHLGKWSKNVGFGSALFTQFWRCKYGFVYYSNVHRTFKDGKIKSTVFTYEATCDETSQDYESYGKE